MTQEWAKDEVMWLNPPWRMWPEVTEKVMRSECEAICILPAWSKPWIQWLVGAATRRVYFEAGVRMFEVDGRPVPNTLWGVWALRIKAGPRTQGRKEDVLKELVFIPRWRPLQAMGTACQEGTEERSPRNPKGAEPKVVAQVENKSAKRALDLFSGTGSVSEELQRQGYEVVTLDVDPLCKATRVEDLMQWDYPHAGYAQGSFEVIWASPPCEQFSRARTTAPRELERADALVKKTLEVIRWFKPGMWFLENPGMGC